MHDLRDRLAAALAPRYIVDRELAAGGMGVVFLGRDPVLGREVAIKVLPPEHATAIAVERFLREARLLARLAHPHIVTILEANQQGGLLWFVMPLIEGDTLAARLARGPLPANEVRRLGMDLSSALEHAHDHGVIHRDIKPSNIFLLGRRGLLADFGVAQLELTPDESLTETGQAVGTLRYMAPEQLIDGSVSAQSDVYALAATLFEAASGSHWTLAAASDSRTWHKVPRQLRPALRGALHADPARRWQSVEAFRHQLAAARRRVAPRVVVGAASVLALTAYLLGHRASATASGLDAPRKAALLVLPFEGGASTLGATLAQLTSFQLEAAPIPAGVFPASRVVGFDLSKALHLAQQVVAGTVADSGVLLVSLYDSAGRGSTFRVPSQGADAAVWGRAVADSLVRRTFPQQLEEFRQLGAFPNLDALKAYTAGQQLFQRGDWEAAERMFAEAEGRDPQLFEASWGRLLARQWERKPFEADMARLAARFPPPLDELARIQLEPDIARRLARYDSLALQYPSYPMVREMQANEVFSRGPLAGRPLREGIDSFRSLAQHFPSLDEPTTYTQTVWGLVRLGDRALAAEQFARRKSKALPGDPWTRMLWLAMKGRFQRWLAAPARDFMLWRADSGDIATLRRAVRLGLEVDDPQDQLAIGAALARREPSTDSMRASAYAAQATALLLLGRPTAALARLDSGARRVPGNRSYGLQVAEWRVLLPLLPGAPVDVPASEREAGRTQLRGVPASDSVLWPRAAWALTIDAIAAGDGPGRDSLLARLRLRASQPGVADLVAFADAISAGAAGDPSRALAASQRIFHIPSESESAVRGSLTRALIYLHRGDWQLQLNNRAAAESEWIWHENNDVRGWPSGEPEEGEMDAALSAAARLRRGENLLLLDRAVEGCALLHRVLVLWSGAEPGIQPLRRRADAAVARCRS